MKIFFILSLLVLLISADNLCMDYGWSGCHNGACFKEYNGFCANFGKPPNNDCRCVNPDDYTEYPQTNLDSRLAEAARNAGKQLKFNPSLSMKSPDCNIF